LALARSPDYKIYRARAEEELVSDTIYFLSAKVPRAQVDYGLLFIEGIRYPNDIDFDTMCGRPSFNERPISQSFNKGGLSDIAFADEQ